MSCHIHELRAEIVCAGICLAQDVALSLQCSRCEAASCSSLAQDKRRGHAILFLRGSREGRGGLCRHQQAQCCWN